MTEDIVDIVKWRTVMPLGDIDAHTLEIACAAYYDHGLDIGQYNWHQLVEREDGRIPIWREKMRAALTAIELKDVPWEIYLDDRS